MKYPVDIEKFIRASKVQSSSPEVEALLRSVLPLVNEAYEQGKRDGRTM